jgi:hypothetical protein
MIRRGAAKAKASPAPGRDAAAALAIEALSYLVADGERMARFLALTGIDPTSIRAAAREPGFLAGVLDHICGDEQLLIAFAEHAGTPAEHVAAARACLAGAEQDR